MSTIEKLLYQLKSNLTKKLKSIKFKPTCTIKCSICSYLHDVKPLTNTSMSWHTKCSNTVTPLLRSRNVFFKSYQIQTNDWRTTIIICQTLYHMSWRVENPTKRIKFNKLKPNLNQKLKLIGLTPQICIVTYILLLYRY